jgi:hypothetical protein
LQAITDTLSYTPQPLHILLDWTANLTQALVPPTLSSTESATAFLRTVDNQVQWWLPQVSCLQYSLAKSRLYEIKQRFHLLVQTTTTVIQGNPMMNGSLEEQ